MKSIYRGTILVTLATLLPLLSHSQGVAADLHSLQGVLNTLYDQMIPLCRNMINIGRGIGGFGALWYIGSRVWKHLASAEPIDIYPLLRPFAIGFCIVFFPSVLALMNGVLQPTVAVTNAMVTTSNQAIMKMLDPAQPQNIPNGSGANPNQADPDKYYQYTHPDNTSSSSTANGSSNPIADAFSGWGIKNMVRKWIAELLNVLFEAAALCIDTIRTFKLIVLAILGPLCFGLSIFDGFQHTLKQWIARYVNVYMWLPVANIFGAIIAKIQENMLQLEQSGGAANPHFGDTNTAYLIFMVIGIVGYFTVPGIANYIVNVGGHALLSKTSGLASMAASYMGGAVTQTFLSRSQNNESSNTTNTNAKTGENKSFISNKLSGKT